MYRPAELIAEKVQKAMEPKAQTAMEPLVIQMVKTNAEKH